MRVSLLFFFNATPTTEIYTLSLHDALPICLRLPPPVGPTTQPRAQASSPFRRDRHRGSPLRDRKSTRLNSSHTVISYAVFCLKKKKHALPLKCCCSTSIKLCAL